MRAPGHARPDRLARGLALKERAQTDPAVTAGRGLRVRAVPAALGAGWRGIRRGLSGLAGVAERCLLAPLLGRSERRRALTELAAMDDRLLADIGLRRGDIELAVDGRLADPRIADALPAAVRESGWLGFEGASEAAIAGAEARLGTVLPPSYREFLATTNGWRNVGAFIERAWPAEQVDWFRVRNQGWIDAYAGPMAGAGLPESAEGSGVYGDEQDPVDFPTDHLQSALEISEAGDSAILLLNPRVVTPDGEWEAWFFANWLPGAERYRSFRELMEAERRRFADLRRDDDRPRPKPRPPGLLSILWREMRASWRASWSDREGGPRR